MDSHDFYKYCDTNCNLERERNIAEWQPQYRAFFKSLLTTWTAYAFKKATLRFIATLDGLTLACVFRVQGYGDNSAWALVHYRDGAEKVPRLCGSLTKIFRRVLGNTTRPQEVVWKSWTNRDMTLVEKTRGRV